MLWLAFIGVRLRRERWYFSSTPPFPRLSHSWTSSNDALAVLRACYVRQSCSMDSRRPARASAVIRWLPRSRAGVGLQACRLERFSLGVRKVITRGLVWVRAGEVEETEEDVRSELNGRAAHWKCIYAIASPGRTDVPRTSSSSTHHGTSFPV